MQVRSATVEDVPALVAMGVRFMTSTIYGSRLRTNPDALGGLMLRLIQNDDGEVFVLDGPRGIEGMLGMIAYAHPISGDMIAGEVFWWCEARGHGVRLLHAGERWADEMGVTAVQMVAPDSRAAAIYQRRGYTILETTYQRELH